VLHINKGTIFPTLRPFAADDGFVATGDDVELVLLLPLLVGAALVDPSVGVIIGTLRTDVVSTFRVPVLMLHDSSRLFIEDCADAA